jgi:hydrophobe/amphiphile efflux-1 (HAE1) family protein
MTLVRDQVKDRFSSLEGVGEIILGGYIDPALRVWVTAEKLNRYQLTATDIINSISSENAEIPAGKLETSNLEFNMRTLGEAPSAKEFGQIPILRRGGAFNHRPIPISEVARVEEGLNDVRRISRSNGKTAIGIGIKKQAGANAVQVAKTAKAMASEIQKGLPSGVQINTRFDSTQFIEEAVAELNFTLILSALLTALVCWMFLGSWSATLNVILAIPTSIIGTFIVLYALGFTLNTFTLLALSLAIGIVVDDAIMVLENIVRHFESGPHKGVKVEASRVGAKEVTFAATAATAAIVAIFLPIAFMEGVIGKFLFQFGITLSAAVLFSLLEALTLTPMRCASFLKKEPRTTRFGRAVESVFLYCEKSYRELVPLCIKHRYALIGVSTLVFIGTLVLGRKITREFEPSQDQSMLRVNFYMPAGTPLEVTDQQLKKIETTLLAKPEVEGIFSSIGGFGSGDVSSANIFVNLVPKSKRKQTQQELQKSYRQELKAENKGLNVNVGDPSRGSFGIHHGTGIELTIRGPDYGELIKSSQKVVEALNQSKIIKDAYSNYQEGTPELQIIPNRERARERGVSVTEIARTINSLVGGVVAGKFSKGGHRYDVRLRLEQKDREKSADLKKLYVRNNRGELISLSEVVTLKEGKTVQSISRTYRERAISIYGSIDKGTGQDVAIAEALKIANDNLPKETMGYRAVIGGNSKMFQETNQSLLFALLLGVVISYMILASQFNSFIHPITVLIALPMSLSGAFLALYLTGNTLNIYSMIGIILLMGIVKKNSILLVDFTNQTLNEGGKSVSQALEEACPKRLRPILMTSFATIAGALPAAFAFGPGAETRIPMALTLIGGVLMSTLLTLFLVPAVYSVFQRKI